MQNNNKIISKNLQKYQYTILILLNFIIIAIFYFLLNLKIFTNFTNTKYSAIDKLLYLIQCQNKRHIKLRENPPGIIDYRIPPYDKTAKYRFATDENGFVKPSKIHESPDLKIFFFGGSTTECENVDEQFRFPYLAGRIIEEKTKKKVNSYNGGKSGNNSIHSINNIINKVVPLKPDIIVRMENINDLSTLLYEESFYNNNVSRSNLGCFDIGSKSLRRFKNEFENSPFKDKIFDLNHQNKIKANYRQILELFIAITKAAGAKPVLMTQYNSIENNVNFSVREKNPAFDAIYRQLYSDFQNITRETAKENNILLIDLNKIIPPTYDKYIYDTIHYNNEGSKLVAKIVAEHLIKIINKQ